MYREISFLIIFVLCAVILVSAFLMDYIQTVSEEELSRNVKLLELRSRVNEVIEKFFTVGQTQLTCPVNKVNTNFYHVRRDATINFYGFFDIPFFFRLPPQIRTNEVITITKNTLDLEKNQGVIFNATLLAFCVKLENKACGNLEYTLAIENPNENFYIITHSNPELQGLNAIENDLFKRMTDCDRLKVPQYCYYNVLDSFFSTKDSESLIPFFKTSTKLKINPSSNRTESCAPIFILIPSFKADIIEKGEYPFNVVLYDHLDTEIMRKTFKIVIK